MIKRFSLVIAIFTATSSLAADKTFEAVWKNSGIRQAACEGFAEAFKDIDPNFADDCNQHKFYIVEKTYSKTLTSRFGSHFLTKVLVSDLGSQCLAEIRYVPSFKVDPNTGNLVDQGSHWEATDIDCNH